MKKIGRALLIFVAAVGIFGFTSNVWEVRGAEPQLIEDGIYIGNVNVGGMTEEQAHSAVEEYVSGLMNTTFSLKGETGSMEMTAEEMGISADTDAAVEEAVQTGHAGNLINRFKSLQDLKKDKLVLDMHLSVDKQATARKLYTHADELAVGAKDNGLKRENGEFRFVPGKEGMEIDIVNSVYAINDFLSKEWNGSDNEIALVTKTVEPRGSREELAQVKDLLGSFSTNFSSSSAGRAKNVKTGCSKINGTILYPGDEFKMCQTVSPFTQENGYELAGSYQNGTTVESFGGGICQVATTLYNAVIRAELEVTMRFNHSMQVHYVKPSMDAAIAGDYKDLRFKNNTDAPVYLEGYCSGGILYFNVYGKEVRPTNREVSFESETLSTVEPKVSFVLSADAELGSVSVQGGSNIGCVAQLWKIVKIDGVEQSREIFNKSRYQASPKVITVGTKNAEAESLAALKQAVASGDEAKVRSAAAALKSNDEQEEPATEEKPDTQKPDTAGTDNAGSGKGETKPQNSQKPQKPQKEETPKPSDSNQGNGNNQSQGEPSGDNQKEETPEEAPAD